MSAAAMWQKHPCLTPGDPRRWNWLTAAMKLEICSILPVVPCVVTTKKRMAIIILRLRIPSASGLTNTNKRRVFRVGGETVKLVAPHQQVAFSVYLVLPLIV